MPGDEALLDAMPDTVDFDEDAGEDDDGDGDFDFGKLFVPGGGGSGSGGGSGAFPRFGYGRGSYAAATADRVPMISQELRDQNKATQLRIVHISAGGTPKEFGKMHLRAAVEDLIDMTGGVPGTYYIHPIDSTGQPVGDPEPVHIHPRNPHLLEVQATVSPSGGGNGGLSIAEALQMVKDAKAETREDTVTVLGLHAKRENSLREHADRVDARADALTEKMGTREDSIALQRATLMRESSKDQAGMIAGIFASNQAASDKSMEAMMQLMQGNQAAQALASQNMMAMIVAMNQPKKSIFEEMMSNPMILTMLMDRFMPSGKTDEDPMAKMMQMMTFMKAMNPDNPQPTMMEKLQEMTALKGLMGDGQKSDMVQMAELAASTVGDLTGTIMGSQQQAKQIAGPTEIRKKKKQVAKAPAASTAPAATTATREFKQNVTKAAILLENEPGADATRIVAIVEGQFGGDMPQGVDWAAELRKAELPEALIEAAAAALNNKEG